MEREGEREGGVMRCILWHSFLENNDTNIYCLNITQTKLCDLRDKLIDKQKQVETVR